MSEQKVIAAAGIGGAVLLLIGQLLVINAPTIDSPPAEIRSWAVDHRTAALTAIYLLVLGFAVQVIFWVGLWRELRSGDGVAGLTANAGLAAAIVLTAILAGGFVFTAMLDFRASQLSDEMARSLNDLTFVSVNLSGIVTALTLAPFAAAILVGRRLPTWMGWFALAIAAVHLIAGGSFAHAGFFSPQGIGVYVAPPLYYVWIIAASVILLRRGEVAVPRALGALTG